MRCRNTIELSRLFCLLNFQELPSIEFDPQDMLNVVPFFFMRFLNHTNTRFINSPARGMSAFAYMVFIWIKPNKYSGPTSTS